MAYRGEGDIKVCENTAERGVVTRKSLALHHVDHKVHEYDEAKDPLPRVGSEEMLHSELPKQLPLSEGTEAGLGLRRLHLRGLYKGIMRHSLNCELTLLLYMRNPCVAAI